MARSIVFIDEDKCDGCGHCIPACHEGALEIVGGKARLVADRLCDGLGACLGQCPRGALRIESREAVSFDEAAVTSRLREVRAGAVHLSREGAERSPAVPKTACPSARIVQISHTGAGGGKADPAEEPSELTHWPVQLRLLPPTSPAFRGASLLLAADCVPVAVPAFHNRLLRGRTVAVACPKLDDARGHLEKLVEILRRNDLNDITVARMDVPCCSGLLILALEARRLSEKTVPIFEVVVGTRGEIQERKQVDQPVRALHPG